MKIYVRRRHIEGGKRLDCEMCPIALAIKEITGKYTKVLTAIARVSAAPPFALPHSARRFIQRFDSGEPVKPFMFVLKYRAKRWL